VHDHEPAGRGDTADDRRASIDDLLDRAVYALNSGDREAATVLAGEVLAIDDTNTDAEDLLASPDETGEMRRLTLVFIDLVETGWSAERDSRIVADPAFGRITGRIWAALRDQSIRALEAAR